MNQLSEKTKSRRRRGSDFGPRGGLTGHSRRLGDRVALPDFFPALGIKGRHAPPKFTTHERGTSRRDFLVAASNRNVEAVGVEFRRTGDRSLWVFLDMGLLQQLASDGADRVHPSTQVAYKHGLPIA